MRYFTYMLLLFATLVTGGCSVMRAGYQRLDWVTLVWMDRQLDLTSEQKDALRPQLKQLLIWHRHNELPAYVALIENGLEPMLAKDHITPEQWLAIMEQLRVRYVALARQAATQAEPMVNLLGPDQYKALKESFDKSNVKFRKKHLEPSLKEIQAQRAEDFHELIDDWLGRLSDAQEKAIIRNYQHRTIDNSLWWDERQTRQQLMLQALARKPGESSPTLADAFLSLLDPVSPRGQLYLTRTHRDTAELLSELWSLSTPKQREKAREKAANWKADIKKLM